MWSRIQEWKNRPQFRRRSGDRAWRVFVVASGIVSGTYIFFSSRHLHIDELQKSNTINDEK
jgi:hypothetical protein